MKEKAMPEKQEKGKKHGMKVAIIVSMLKKKSQKDKADEKCGDCGKGPCQCEE